METNGDFKKYFNALNKRLDVAFEAIDKRFAAVDARFDGIERRFEAIEQHLDGIEQTVEVQGQAILSMQDSLATVIRTTTLLATQFKKLEKRVERLEIGQTELIKMVMEIRGLESGKKLELKNVQYDKADQTLTGTIREKPKRYGRNKK